MIRRLLLLAAMAMVATVFSIPTASAGGFCADPSAFSSAETTEIAITDYCFSPTVAYVQPGDTVTFTNKDAAVHNLGGVNDVFGNLHEEVAPGDDISYTFDDEGTYPYLCILHPGMAGAIVVGDGRFEDNFDAAIGGAPAEPPSDTAEATGETVVPTTPASDDGTPAWIVVAGLVLGLGILAIAAIPIRRQTTFVSKI
jgi:plastocyanin